MRAASIYERIHGLHCFRFPFRVNAFEKRACFFLLLATTICVIAFTSRQSALNVAARIDYAKTCSLLYAFNVSNRPQSLSPALLAAAAELANSNPGKIEMLRSASQHDKQLTPREYRGRALTSGTFWVILSCNDDPVYAFSIPIVSQAWATVAGARPLVLLVGPGYNPDDSQTPRHSWVTVFIATLKELSIDFIVLNSHGVSPITFSQVSRLFGMKLQRFKPLDYVLFGDSDLLPLNGATYHTDRNWQRNLHIVNAFCCGSMGNIDGKIVNQELPFKPSASHPIEHDPRILHIAMCHAGATVSTWNNILAMNVSDQWDEAHLEQYVESLILQNRASHDKHEPSTLDAWYLDQLLLSSAINAWSFFPDQVEFVLRDVGKDRIDRSAWKIPENLEGFIDSHLLRPSYDHENWPKIIPLLKLIFDPVVFEKIEAYRQFFVDVLTKS